MRTFRYVIADVFTDRPLTGNQLAVFTDARGLSAETNCLPCNVGGWALERGLLHDGSRLLSLHCVAQIEEAKRSSE